MNYWRFGTAGAAAAFIVLLISHGIAQAEIVGTLFGLLPIVGFGAAGGMMLARYYAQAVTDEGTGLYNRRYLFQRLERLHRHHHSINSPLAVAVIDIDDFRSFNTRYGHMAGDEVLKEVATRLKRSLRPGDLAARWGGEEFAIAFQCTGETAALEVAEAIRQSIEATGFTCAANKEALVTISVGIVVDRGSYRTVEDLVNHADQMMYTAKQKKNTVEVGWLPRSA